jgi:hypothetical protein
MKYAPTKALLILAALNGFYFLYSLRVSASLRMTTAGQLEQIIMVNFTTIASICLS